MIYIISSEIAETESGIFPDVCFMSTDFSTGISSTT